MAQSNDCRQSKGPVEEWRGGKRFLTFQPTTGPKDTAGKMEAAPQPEAPKHQRFTWMETTTVYHRGKWVTSSRMKRASKPYVERDDEMSTKASKRRTKHLRELSQNRQGYVQTRLDPVIVEMGPEREDGRRLTRIQMASREGNGGYREIAVFCDDRGMHDPRIEYVDTWESVKKPQPSEATLAAVQETTSRVVPQHRRMQEKSSSTRLCKGRKANGKRRRKRVYAK